MTNLQEAKLAREAEICYATLAMVTDYDCWHPGHDSVTADQIIANLLHERGHRPRPCSRGALRRIPREPRTCECATALRHALVTPAELVPDDVKRELQPIIGRYMR